MIKWFHHLLNPHCSDCIPVCQSCENLKDEIRHLRENGNDEVELLKEQLAFANSQIRELHELFLEKNAVRNEPPVDKTEPKPIQTAFIPWRVKQQMLEREDREAARLKKELAEKEKIQKPVETKIQELEESMDIQAGTNRELDGNANA